MGYAAKWLGLVAGTAVIMPFAEIPGFFEELWNLMPPAMAQSSEARHAEADRLFQHGIAQYDHSQFQQAIYSWEQALAIYRDIGDRRGEGQALGGIGNAYRNLGQNEHAIDFFEKSLMIAREIGSLSGERNALDNLGDISLSLGQYERAIDFYEQDLVVAREIDDPSREGNALNNLGNVYISLGQYEFANDFYKNSLAIARETGDRAGESATLGNLGRVYISLGEYEHAIDFFDQDLAISREIGNRMGEGRALGNLGIAYRNLGQYESAIDFFEKSLVIFRETDSIRTQKSIVFVLGNLGNVYNDLGQYEHAIDFFRQSLILAREIGDRAGEGNALGNLGRVYRNLGQYEHAIDFFEQDLEISREIGDRAGEGATLGAVGVAYANQGQYERAIDFLEQDLAISRQISSRKGESRALGNLGSVYASQGQYERAIDFFEQGLEISREIGSRMGEGLALGNLGIAYRHLEQYDLALDFHRQALSIFSVLGSQAEEGLALSNIGNLFNLQDQPELAIAFLRASVNVRESIRGDIRGLDTDLQQSFTDTVADTYRTLADLLLARGEILEAQRVLELLKVQELQEFTRSRVTNLETRDYDLDPAEKTVIDAHSSLVAFGLKRSECVASPDCSTATLDDLDTQYDQLSDAYTKAVEQLMAERRDEQEARARQADGQLLQARQELSPEGFAGTAGVLTRNHPGTVLAYPVVLDDKLWVLWGSAGGAVSAIEVPAGRERIGDAVLRFRQLMTACERGGCDARDIPAVQAVAQELYQYLIPAPLEDELQALQATLPEGQVPNLVIVPDLVTRYIPFAALHDGQQYLIEKYAISTLLGAEQTTADNPLTSIDGTSILGLGLSNPVPEHGFPFPLENVPEELAAIVQTSATEPGIFRGETHLNDDFDLEKLRLARRHQVLHLATHGVFDPKANDLSFLMLGVGRPLYIRDLQNATNYFGNLSLVVLSACETALSDIDQSGLELASIASTFLQARVDTVVASLWQVSDSATSDLMQQFYGSLAQSTPEQRVSVGQALRQAQLAMLYGNESADATSRASIAIETTGPGARASDLPRTAHPYYWSPFTIIGNGL